MVILLEIFFLVYFLLEAWLEVIIIKLKNPSLINYQKLNKQEHNRSFILAAFLIIGVCFISNLLFLIPSAILSRRLFFDYPLKLMRGRKIKNIEGTGVIDSSLRKILGPKGGWYELGIVVFLKFVYLYLIISYGQ